jgi:nitrogen fixation/metabolism regulation signal transduction histidine kinase
MESAKVVPANQNARPKRRQYLINPRFQMAFIAYTIIAAFAMEGVHFVAVQLFVRKITAYARMQGLPDNVFFNFASEQIRLINYIFLISAVATGLILFIAGIFISHRIAGPLYRLHKHLTGIAQGNKPTEVHFRKGDFFPELADAFNGVLAQQENVLMPPKAEPRRATKRAG